MDEVAVGSECDEDTVKVSNELSSGSLVDGLVGGGGVKDVLKLVEEENPCLIDIDGRLGLSAHPSYQPLTPEKTQAR
jgi:hypothetical protein